MDLPHADFYHPTISNRDQVTASVKGLHKAFRTMGLIKAAESSRLSDETLFWRIRFGALCRLDEPEIQQEIQRAVTDNNLALLAEIVELLKKGPVKDSEIKNHISHLETILLVFWCPKKWPYTKWLATFSDPAIIQFLRELHKINCSPEVLEKTRQRLGLVKTSPVLFCGLQLIGGTYYPIPYKKFRRAKPQ